MSTSKTIKLLSNFEQQVVDFKEFGAKTAVSTTTAIDHRCRQVVIPTYVNEFWTSKQRQASKLHEISYRACFKPQLPRFFIERLTEPGDTVYDPFMGRGTTIIEAALLDRTGYGCDINPLSAMLTRPRLNPPPLDAIHSRLACLDFEAAKPSKANKELEVFYHAATLVELCSLRSYLLGRQKSGKMDRVDEWIRMVAISRLTGHSSGFFSVYTLPPNQAVSMEAQMKINQKRNQFPDYRSVPILLLAKSRQILAGCSVGDIERLSALANKHTLVTAYANATARTSGRFARLAVTSPPFLDVVDYAGDNWLRCWFAGIDPETVDLAATKNIDTWKKTIVGALTDMRMLLLPGGVIAFEVGEIRGGRVNLEEHVIPCATEAGLAPRMVIINKQAFSKTSHCWGVKNNTKGTNTNRIVVMEKI